MNEEKQHLEQPHSVKFAINSKGQWTAEVKCYGPTPEEALKRSCAISAQVETILKQKNGE